jgi:hypothetical protein
MPARIAAAAVGVISIAGGVRSAAAVHLPDDVAAADQLPVDVQLRNGRPVAVLLDAFA